MPCPKPSIDNGDTDWEGTGFSITNLAVWSKKMLSGDDSHKIGKVRLEFHRSYRSVWFQKFDISSLSFLTNINIPVLMLTYRGQEAADEHKNVRSGRSKCFSSHKDT